MATSALTKFSALTLLLAGSAASAQSIANGSLRLQLTVPLVCTVSHQAAISAAGSGYMLGDLREFCNSPSGYLLTVNYMPGSLKGAVVSVGDQRVLLDGSGQAVISHEAGPRIRNRAIFAEPGPQGFDTDRIEFNIQAS